MKKIDGEDLVVLTPAEYKEIAKPYIYLGKLERERKKKINLQLQTEIEKLKQEAEVRKNALQSQLWKHLMNKIGL